MDNKFGAADSGLVLSVFDEVTRGSPIVVSVFDRDGRFVMHIGKGLERLGLRPNQLVGASVFEAFAGADDALRMIRAALAGHTDSNTQDLGNSVWDNWFSPLRDAGGEIVGAVSVSTDVTERERVRLELERRVAEIEAQSRAMRQMAAPIIQVWEGVLVVPVVGDLDAEGAQVMMQRLLEALSASRARFAILDLTGVETLDTRTADQLLRIVGAVALLGVSAIVSGIRPTVAQALVGIGVDLSRVATTATLHDALRRCMQPDRA